MLQCPECNGIRNAYGFGYLGKNAKTELQGVMEVKLTEVILGTSIEQRTEQKLYCKRCYHIYSKQEIKSALN